MHMRVMNWVAVGVLCAALGTTEAALGQEAAQEREISIVVEEGDRVPAQVLDTLAAQELGSGSTANVTFSVIEGQARLADADGQTVDAISGGAVAHPEIIAGPHYDETYVRVVADGNPIGKPIRVGTIASGSLDQLLAKDVPTGSEALLLRAANYASVDTGLLRSMTLEGTTEPSAGQYCSKIVDKERDVYGQSRILAEACSDQSKEDALAQARSKALASGAGVEAISYLVTFFEHAGYGGRSADVYGCCGTCDWDGYVIPTRDVGPDTFWRSNLSSLARLITTRCYYVRYRRAGENWGATRTLPDWYVGDYYNDRILDVKIWG